MLYIILPNKYIDGINNTIPIIMNVTSLEEIDNIPNVKNNIIGNIITNIEKYDFLAKTLYPSILLSGYKKLSDLFITYLSPYSEYQKFI